MPDIAAVLKSEIARLARKEVRTEIDGLKKQVAAHRGALSDLKRQNAELQRLVKQLAKHTLAAAQSARGAANGEAAQPRHREFKFSSDWLIAQRKRLGLSPAECALLVGASDQSIYKWEKDVHPRQKYLPALACLAQLGKRKARARLAELQAA